MGWWSQSEHRRSEKLDRGHGATLRRGQRGSMLLAQGFTVVAEGIRRFEPQSTHRTSGEETLRPVRLWFDGRGVSGASAGHYVYEDGIEVIKVPRNRAA
jgi:hypothetical protein